MYGGVLEAFGAGIGKGAQGDVMPEADTGDRDNRGEKWGVLSRNFQGTSPNDGDPP